MLKKPTLKKLPRTVVTYKKRTGKITSKKRDLSRNALPPGLRLSKSNNYYVETRRNRSDTKKKKL